MGECCDPVELDVVICRVIAKAYARLHTFADPRQSSEAMRRLMCEWQPLRQNANILEYSTRLVHFVGDMNVKLPFFNVKNQIINELKEEWDRSSEQTQKQHGQNNTHALVNLRHLHITMT